jgi:3-hydroxyacyl-[acyl-carrier-protein] dehydratase
VDTETENEPIRAAIPHRAPMLLLDRIVHQSPRRIVCQKRFSSDDFFVQGHFPGFPLVPGVILCECCLQAGAVLIASDTGLEDGVLPVATRMDGVKFKKMVRPGDTVDIEVDLTDILSQAYYLTGKITVGGKIAARLDFVCSVAKAE